MVAAGEGGQALDVHAEQPREGVGLGVAEGWELAPPRAGRGSAPGTAGRR